MYHENLDQNEMAIEFCFIIDILFMDLHLILMFFKEGILKKMEIGNGKKYIKASCSNFVIIWRQNGWNENNNFIAKMIRFNKALKSLHFSGKFSYNI